MTEPKTIVVSEFCRKLDEWAALVREDPYKAPELGTFAAAWGTVRMAIGKSCLLDRTVYCGEIGPSKTPCPVHKGRWSGIHLGWPGQKWHDVQGNTTPVDESPWLRKEYDDGCRCFQHKCGCTTGWQPDRACGCEKEEAVGVSVKDVDAADIVRFGGRLENCQRHRDAWQASCDKCGYSFERMEDLVAYQQFCGFGPTVYRIVKADKNPITAEKQS